MEPTSRRVRPDSRPAIGPSHSRGFGDYEKDGYDEDTSFVLGHLARYSSTMPIVPSPPPPGPDSAERQAQVMRAIAWLNLRWSNPHLCPICSTDSWQVDRSGYVSSTCSSTNS